MRLIDADALQNILITIATALENEYGSLGGAVSGCMKHIDNAPTIDAVHVVRCKDCVNYDTNNCSEGFGWCENLGIGVHDDFFCKVGERKEGADNGND